MESKQGEGGVAQMLYDQIKDLHNRVNTLQAMYDQIKDHDVEKLITCKTTRSKFSSILNRTTAFMNSIQKQFNTFIEDLNEIKDTLALHDKSLYVIQKDIHGLIKDKLKTDEENKLLNERLSRKDADLDERIKKQEPFRYLLTALLIVLSGLVGLFFNLNKIIETLKKFFIPG